MQLKLCGNHSQHDTICSVESNADYIGFVFAPSKRQTTPNDVRKWLNETPLCNDQQVVGVFVNPSIEKIAETLRSVPLDIIQLHGNESSEFVAQIKNNFSCKIWKTIHHEQAADQKMASYKEYVDLFLIDNKSQFAWGGTGSSFDWTSIPNYMSAAHALGKPCFIAGGITPDNVAELLSRYQPDGIDLASGVETNGQKDKRKIIQLRERIESHEQQFT